MRIRPWEVSKEIDFMIDCCEMITLLLTSHFQNYISQYTIKSNFVTTKKSSKLEKNFG